jgi:hypothetical protein
MLGKVSLLASLSFAQLYAIEACAIVHAAELIVVGKLNNAKYSASPKPARITGRLHIAGVVTGTRPGSTQVGYDFDCSRCRELEPRDIKFVSKEYGIWFLRKDGDVWTSAFPRSTDPGYQPLDRLEHYKASCLQGRRYSDEPPDR